MTRILRIALLGLQDITQNFGIYVIIMLFAIAGVVSYDIGKEISITHGLASFVGTFLFWAAGSGFRASLIRNKNVKGEQGQNLMFARFAVSIGIIIGGYFLLTYSQVQPNIFGISFSPISWGILAIVIGFIFVKKEQAL